MNVEKILMQTYSGQLIDHFNPDIKTFKIIDIAHGLSNNCRYNGQCCEFYSVAEHSILVSDALFKISKDPSLALLGLMHDAAEAYLSDIPGMLKSRINNFDELEANLLEKILYKFGFRFPITREMPSIVKEIDIRILINEMEYLFNNNYKPIEFFKKEYKKLDNITILCLRPDIVRKKFLDKYYELRFKIMDEGSKDFNPQQELRNYKIRRKIEILQRIQFLEDKIKKGE